MKIKIITLIALLCFTIPLINGCGKDEKGGHFSGDGGGNMNFEQQALKKEQKDIAKLKIATGALRPVEGGDREEIKSDPKEVVATVNGDKIIRLELERISDNVKSKVSSSRFFFVQKRILDDLVTQLLLKQFIEKQNIEIEQSRIDDEIKKFRENLKKNPDTEGKSLELMLGEKGGSVEELRVALDISFSIDDYLDGIVNEEDLREYFANNLGSFNGEKVTASHILLETKYIKDEEKLKEIENKIISIRSELNQGADFAELAGIHSNCPSAKNGGNLGAFGRGEMVKELTDAAFATNVNEICGPIKTQFGYHIIKVTDKQEGKDIKYEDFKDRVKIAHYNEKTVSLIQDLTQNADIKISLKEPPKTASSHGSMRSHGSSYSGGSGRGGVGSGGPHWNIPSGSMPQGHGGKSSMPQGHGGMSSSGGGMPPGHGSMTEKSVESTFSLTK